MTQSSLPTRSIIIIPVPYTKIQIIILRKFVHQTYFYYQNYLLFRSFLTERLELYTESNTCAQIPIEILNHIR